MKKISVHEIINDLIDETHASFDNMRPTLIRWAIQADLKIDTEYQYKRKYAVLTVNNCCSEIPCDGVHILGVIYGDYGIDCGLYFDDFFANGYKYIELETYDESNTLVTYAFTWSDETVRPIPVRWHIEGNEIVFEDCLDGNPVTICYLGYDTDPEGFPLINESHRDALVTKLKIKLLEREKFRKVMSTEYINQIAGDIVGLKRQYNFYVRQARAEDMDPSNSAKNDIAEILNNPLTGAGNYLLKPVF